MKICKAHKNLIAGMALAGVLFGNQPTSFAAEPGLQGQPILATPYDGRLMEAGALIDVIPAEGSRSSDQLFSQARSFRYKEDGRGNDHWQTPEETEQRWSGDCEDKAVWLYAQLKKNNHRGVRLVVGRKDRSSRSFHVWVALEASNGSYFILDPTAQKRIWNASDFSDGSYRPLYSFDGINRYRHDS